MSDIEARTAEELRAAAAVLLNQVAECPHCAALLREAERLRDAADDLDAADAPLTPLLPLQRREGR